MRLLDAGMQLPLDTERQVEKVSLRHSSSNNLLELFDPKCDVENFLSQQFWWKGGLGSLDPPT